MKRSLKIIAIAAIFAVSAGIALYFRPRTFLKNVEPEKVGSIAVFDGNTGKNFTISDSGEVREIVENINSTEMKRGKMSLGYMGYTFRMDIMDEDSRIIDSFVLNSADCIRDDPFFYYCDGRLCFDYLTELEKTYAK